MSGMSGNRIACLSFGALAAALAGCASGPTDTPALVQARQTYAVTAASPEVAAAAPLELRRAEEALRAAETASREGADRAEVDHRAYIATRRAEIAQDFAHTKGAQAVVANADAYRLQARNVELEQQLRDLQAERTERGLVMTLGDVLFATGRADLTPGAMTRIDRLAQFMQRYPDRTVRVEGYTDSTGSADANLHLSERRAQAVHDALVARGVNPARVVTHGFGEARPVASNATESGRQQNRRVDVVISDTGAVAETRY